MKQMHPGPALATLALSLLVATPLVAKPSEVESLRQEIEGLKQGQQQIQQQLDEIKRLLLQQQQQQQRPQPAQRQGPEVKDVTFNLGNNEVKGARDARLTLLEFTDYQ